ncbi:hypothetical protein JW877_02295 [bacterium]|nr:hypothetical protein [bacterium]
MAGSSVISDPIIIEETAFMNCIILEENTACEPMFGLYSPQDIMADPDTSARLYIGDTLPIGLFPAGQELVFFMSFVPGYGLCDHDAVYLSTNPLRCHIIRIATNTYNLNWEDWTDGDYNDLIVRVFPFPVAPLECSLSVDAGPDRWVFAGDTVTIGGVPAISRGIPPYTIQWFPTAFLTNPNITNPGAFPETTTTYILTVMDSTLCSDTSTMTVNVDYPPSIENVRFEQTTDGSQLVTICYDYIDPDGDAASVSLIISSDGGLSWIVPVSTIYDTIGAPTNLGDEVLPGVHCLVWDLGADLPGIEGCEFLVEIMAQTSLRETLTVLDSFLLREARGITYDGNALWVNQSPGIHLPDSFDIIYRIDPHTYSILDSMYFPSWPTNQMEDMAWANDTLYLFAFGMFETAVRARIFKIDTLTEAMVDTSEPVFASPYTGQGLTFDGTNILANDSQARIYKVDPHSLSSTYLYTADTNAAGDTVFFSGHNPDGSAFGMGSLWLVRNGIGYMIFRVDTALGIVTDSFAAPFSGTTSGPEGLAYDGRYFWYCENRMHLGTVYKLGAHNFSVSDTSPPGCLDSRNPQININNSICRDTLLAGSTYTISWEISDDFVPPTANCSLFIALEETSSFNLLGVSDNDSLYIWYPVADTISSSNRLIISAYDSFGNYGVDTSCTFMICRPNPPPIVSDLEFHQRTDGSRMVHINFRVEDPNDDSVYISLKVSTDRGVTWELTPTEFVTPSDTGWVETIPSLLHSIFWDMDRELLECSLENSNIIMRILAEDRNRYHCD